MKWTVAAASVRGASHQRSGLPNQDAVEYRNGDRAGALRAVVAVSDGHGGARHFRSQVGSSLAANTAVNVLHDALQAGGTPEDGMPEAMARILDVWRAAVASDLSHNPFQESELARVAESEGAAARASVERDPLLAYGATLLAAAVTDRGAVYCQLGDGDILAVDDAGETTRPISADERLVANRTTSLCQESALSEMRFAISSEAPALILVSTDGYSNSFRTDRDFLQIGADYLEIIRKQGMEAVNEELPETLAAASAEGSGDDITLGILYRNASAGRTGAMPAAPPKENKAAAPSSSSATRWIAGGAALLAGAAVLAWTMSPPPPSTKPNEKSTPVPAAAAPPRAVAKPGTAYLEIAGGATLELQAGAPILLQALQPDAPASEGPYAEVRRSAAGGALELVNLSQDAWTVQRPGKNAVEPPVTNGGAVALAARTKIVFRSGVTAVVR